MAGHPSPLKAVRDELWTGTRKSSGTLVLLLYYCPHLHLISEYIFYKYILQNKSPKWKDPCMFLVP